MRQYRMPPSLGIVLSEALKIKIYDHDESDVLLEIDGKEKKILLNMLRSRLGCPAKRRSSEEAWCYVSRG